MTMPSEIQVYLRVGLIQSPPLEYMMDGGVLGLGCLTRANEVKDREMILASLSASLSKMMTSEMILASLSASLYLVLRPSSEFVLLMRRSS